MLDIIELQTQKRNKMTDIEQTNYFERKKKEIIEQLLGPGMPFADQVDKPTKSIKKTSKICSRTAESINPSASDPWLSWYNRQIHINHGRIVMAVDTPLESEVAAPIK